MNDLSKLRAPGWSRVVAELTAPAPDDKLFLVRLLSVLAQVSGARQAVFYQVPLKDDPADPRPILVWPYGEVTDAQGRMTVPADALFGGERCNESNIVNARESRDAARAAGNSRQAAVFSLGDELMYDPSNNGTYLIAVPISAGLPEQAAQAPLLGVAVLSIESMSRQAIQTTLALVEVLAGYVFTHATNQALKKTRQASAALDLAARLIAAINTVPGFKGCALQFVNDLCRQLSVDRVALGWVSGSANARRQGTVPGAGRTGVRLTALSDTENLDRRMAMAQKVEAAMEECLDQEQTVLYPPPAVQGDAVLGQAITHAHRELASSDAKLKVASFPLRLTDAKGERIIGVVLIESAGDGNIELTTIELVQATLDLIAPVLAVRHSDDRALPLRAWDSAVKAGAWAVGPKHTVWKIVGVLVMVATFLLFFVTVTYRVGAPMELMPRERRTISAPFDGVIAELHKGIEPGVKVTKGQPLVKFYTHEMELSRLQSINELQQYEAEANEALRAGELAKYEAARAQADQIRARRDLLTSQIGRATIVAPIDGTIITGDLKDKVGAGVKLGDKMFEIADLSDMQVVAKVDDRDISLIQIEQTGEIAPKANPSFVVPFVVEAIVPLAQTAEGTNAFEVRGRLERTPGWFRPGMEGQAKFNTEEHSLAWIASRRIVDTLKVWLWW
ncbi:MAG TPA: efflux RND transporter periplasmic adaptor subunit [Phycisphaerales bacterium]|nr:efflux RND transporter periplasmic adaptor subunit [Phycisphaerales bacterium]